MKRWGYLLLVVLAAAMPGGRTGAGTDVAKLHPVEVVSVACTEGMIRVQTDTGDTGVGTSLRSAIEDLHRTASAEVFLETAEYLLIDREEMLVELMDYLRPSCSVCILQGEVQLEYVASYLQLHRPTATLRKYRAGMKGLQILRVTEGRMELVS